MAYRTFSTLVLGIALLSLGCAGQSSPPKDATNTPKATSHDHAHPTQGPHQGDLIELGNEEYHAELVHDEKASAITIYILDAEAKNPVAIEAKEVVINLKHDGKPEQHTLNARSQEKDPEGKSSRFVAEKNEALHHAIEEEGADARLQVTIAGKSYTGKIEHDHAGHEHDEEKGAHDDAKK